MMFWIGMTILVLFLCILCAGYISHMAAIYRDIAHEEAEEYAEKRVDEILEHAEIRVVQRLCIIDEMGK